MKYYGQELGEKYLDYLTPCDIALLEFEHQQLKKATRHNILEPEASTLKLHDKKHSDDIQRLLTEIDSNAFMQSIKVRAEESESKRFREEEIDHEERDALNGLSPSVSNAFAEKLYSFPKAASAANDFGQSQFTDAGSSGTTSSRNSSENEPQPY